MLAIFLAYKVWQTHEGCPDTLTGILMTCAQFYSLYDHVKVLLQEATMVPARHKSPPVIWPKVQTPAVDAGPLADVEFEALPKPEPHVIEGDVIAYRLLHIGDDWTPQVCHALNGAE